MMNLHAALDARKTQHFANRGMNDVIDTSTIFNTRINKTNSMLEKGGEISTGKITIFVNGSAKHCTAMIAVPYGIMGTAAKERDTEESSYNEHGLSFFLLALGTQWMQWL